MIVIFVICFFSSCNKTDGPFVYSVDVAIRVLNVEGTDLLNPSNPESYSLDDIKVYNKVGDKWILYYEPNHGASRGFLIRMVNELTIMTLYPSIENVGTYTETMIKWSEQDSDVIKCDLLKKNKDAYIVIDKVWLNGERQAGRTLTIIK